MKKYNWMEMMAFYFAEKSVGKSIPTMIYKVPKPENLKTMIEMLKKDK